MAQGLYVVYKILNEYRKRDINLTNDELMQVIQSCVDDNENIKENFNRMLKDIDIK